MNFVALEISVNGERLYTVGSENWQSLRAHVWGIRIAPDFITPDMLPEGEEIPDKDIQRIDLHASVSHPGEGTISSIPTRKGNEVISESYRRRQLKLGDVITIKVIETDVADEPNGPKADPRFPGPTIMRADPESK